MFSIEVYAEKVLLIFRVIIFKQDKFKEINLLRMAIQLIFFSKA